jgi:hypothetical protein
MANDEERKFWLRPRKPAVRRERRPLGSVASFGVEQKLAGKRPSPQTQAATSRSWLMNRF